MLLFSLLELKFENRVLPYETRIQLLALEDWMLELFAKSTVIRKF